MKRLILPLILMILLTVTWSAKAQPGCYKAMTGNGVQVGTVGNAGGLCVTQFCLGTGYQELQKVIDADLNTAASYTSLATILNSQGLSVKNYNMEYPAGYVAGYVFSTSSLINLSIFNGIRISTYRAGVFQEEKVVANLISTTILNGEQRHYVTFITTKPFDEVRLRTTGLSANVLNGIKVYSALAFPQNCSLANPANYPCNKPMAGILTDVTFNGAAICAACNLINPQNLIDGDRSNYASLMVPASLVSAPSVGVIDRGAVYPAGFNAGFVVGPNTTNSLATVSMLNSLIIETYLYGQYQESATFNNGAGLLKMNILTFSNGVKQKVGFATTKPFNEIRVRQTQLANATLGLSNIYYAYAEPGTCTDCKNFFGSGSGKYSGAIVGNQLFNTYTGVYGLALHSLTNTGAAVSPGTTDAAVYTPPFVVGLLSGGKLTVKNDGTKFAAGTFVGFDISQNGGLVDASFLSAVTIRTYNVSSSGISLVESSVAGVSLIGGNVLVGNTQRSTVGFKTTKPFNAVQIDISDGIAYAGLGGAINIYGAFTLEDADGDNVPDCQDVCAGDDTKDSDNDGIPDACDVCKAGQVAPAIAGGGLLKNVCPATTVNLPGVSGSMPAGTTLTWHSGPVATTANKLASTTVGASGVYYAAFFDAAGNCYSPTTPDTVKIISCLVPDLDPDFVFGEGAIPGYAPVGLGIEVKNVGAAPTNPLVPVTVTLSASLAENVDIVFDSTTSTIIVSGITINVNNGAWTAVQNPLTRDIVLTLKPGISIPAGESMLIGFAVNQSAINFGDPVELTVNVTPLSGGETFTANNTDFQTIIFTDGGIAGKQAPAAGNALNGAMRVYPNPAHDHVMIAGLVAGQSIAIYNTYGQLLVSKTATDATAQIDLSTYPAGTYVLMVRDGNGKQTMTKIQKLN